MIDKDLQAYHTYRRFLQTLLTICGCWYMPSKSSKSTYYWSVRVLIFLMHFMYILIVLHVSYIDRYNLVNMIKYIGLAISAFGAMLKVGIFMINNESLINYHRTLNDLFEEELTRNEKIRKIMFSSLRKMYSLAYTYFTTFITLVLAYYMPSHLSIIRDLRHFHFPTTNYILPASKRYGYFWTVPDNFLYHLHLLYETVISMISAITACSVDNVFGYYVYQFASTMNAMTFRLTNPSTSEKFLDTLRSCVATHQKLLECRNTLEHVYKTIVFWHIITNAMLLCAVIYQATLAEFHFATLLAIMAYSIIKLLQTFSYAWYGTVLTNAGEDFRNGIYFGEWPSSGLDRHVRTNVILMMMQKSMTINAFFSPINIVMFTNFVNTTMSYFFLLQSVGE